ncbi:MAG: hypothetical protein ACI4AM_07325 [Muribaculaceae bacterium]
MDALLIILLIVFLLFYFGPWLLKKFLLWQLRKMQRRAFHAFNQGAQQQQAQPQPRRSKYADVQGKDAKFEEITSDQPISPSRSYTPTAPKITDAQWEEIS